jgi:signal transduction histidine kinase
MWARIDVNRFRQVMANLLSNAAKFSPEGGQVVTEVRRSGTMLIVSVTDQGRGIPPEFRERIFTPFSQASESSTRDREGTGLGLIISKEIIEQMGGEIGYDSVAGVRTTFWLKLPLEHAGEVAPDLAADGNALTG